MSSASAFITALGETATRHARAEGLRNAVTQFPAITFTDTEIDIFVEEVQTREIDTLHAGRVSQKVMKAYIRGDQAIARLDEITYQGERYEVESIETQFPLLGVSWYKQIVIVRKTD